jgi:NAD-dependent dihydropyrimidine dehydrogenase PreA subunit
MCPVEDAYRLLAEKHGYGESPRYLRVLKFLMTPEQADIVAQLPGSPEEVAERARLGRAMVSQALEELYKKGVVVIFEDRGKECYRFSKYADRMWEVTESLLGMDLYTQEERKRLVQLWDDWKETDYADKNAERWVQLKAAGIQALRIVPAYKSILDSPEILPHEDPREIVRVQPLVTVVSCSCRKHMGVMGRACKKSETDVNCLQFAKSAEYSLARGHGRRVSVDEAIAILDRNEEDGLVHQWINHAKIEAAHPYALCSCCKCCCVIWHAADIRKVPNDAIYAKSRYEARVDAELCEGCRDCLERCQFDAIKMRRMKGSKGLKAVVDPLKCWGCGVCTLTCGSGALRMDLVRPPEHIPPGD